MIFNQGRQQQRRLQAAEGYLSLAMPDQALAELAQVLDPGENAFEWYQLRGEALRAKKEHHQALECLQKANQLKSGDLITLMGMAWCFKRIDRVDQSIEVMRQANQYHADVPVVLYNLACYYSLAGEKKQALSWLGRALRKNPDVAKQIPSEPDFDSLRKDADFLHLLELAAKTTKGQDH